MQRAPISQNCPPSSVAGSQSPIRKRLSSDIYSLIRSEARVPSSGGATLPNRYAELLLLLSFVDPDFSFVDFFLFPR